MKIKNYSNNPVYEALVIAVSDDHYENTLLPVNKYARRCMTMIEREEIPEELYNQLKEIGIGNFLRNISKELAIEQMETSVSLFKSRQSSGEELSFLPFFKIKSVHN